MLVAFLPFLCLRMLKVGRSGLRFVTHGFSKNTYKYASLFGNYVLLFAEKRIEHGPSVHKRNISCSFSGYSLILFVICNLQSL